MLIRLSTLRFGAIVLLGLGLPTMVTAQAVVTETPEGLKSRHERAVAKASGRLAELRTELETFEQGGESSEYYLTLHDYLRTALWAVYEAKLSAAMDHGFGTEMEATNSSLESLVSYGILPAWPANPLNNWQPMRVLGPGEAFSPGDIVFDLCPESEGTTLDGVTKRISFQVYIYGYDPADGYVGAELKGNENWSRKPAGAVYGAGYHMETDAEADARRERQAQRKSEQEKEQPAGGESS